MSFFTEIDKSIPKSIWKHKRPQKAKMTLSKKSNVGVIIIVNFKIYYKAIVRKTAWYKNRHIGNGIEFPHSYSHLISDKAAKNIQWRKESLFIKCYWENGISSYRRLKLDPYLSACTKTNSK
jgi:hypothetical protein